MHHSHIGVRPSTRFRKANVLLANAQAVNTDAVQPRFAAFITVHRLYVAAQTAVRAAATLVRSTRRQIGGLDGAQDRAIVTLMGALLVDGAPRRQPFRRFAIIGPGRMIALAPASKARALRELVAALRRGTGVSPAVLDAADQAEQAARAVEEALPGLEAQRMRWTMARHSRDAVGVRWDTAYTALRYLALSVVEDRTLYRALFARPAHRARSLNAAVEIPVVPLADAAAADAGDADAAAQCSTDRTITRTDVMPRRREAVTPPSSEHRNIAPTRRGG